MSQWQRGTDAPGDLQYLARKNPPKLGESIFQMVFFDGEAVLLCWENGGTGRFQYLILPKIDYSGF